MKKADYSIASEEERANVVVILQRNANEMIEQKVVKDPATLRQLVSRLCDRVVAGEVIVGKDFETLVQLFQKKPVC